MNLDRQRVLGLACVAFAAVSLAFGLVVLLAFALPLRGADPLGAGSRAVIALIAFGCAGAGGTAAALVLTRRER